MKTFVIVGCGHLGNIVANAYRNGLLKTYKLIGAYSRNSDDTMELLKGIDAAVCGDIPSLLALKPDFIVETASIKLLKEFAVEALSKGSSVIPLSIGAFADEEFKESCKEAARKGSSKVYIPSGAVGGFDVLSTISLMAEVKKQDIKAGIHTSKGPNSLKNTPLYDEELQSSKKDVFTGSTKDAISLLPTKVNVAIATALSTIGPDKTSAKITSIPSFPGDDHKLTVETDGLKAVVDIWSEKSDIAAWSVVALLRNLSSEIEFF